TRGNHHSAAFLAEPLTQLADESRLSSAIHTDDEDNRRLRGREYNRRIAVPRLERLANAFGQRVVKLVLRRHHAALRAALDVRDETQCDGHAEVGLEQQLL